MSASSRARGRHLGLLAALLLLTALARAPLLGRQGLWVDEVFSLALATGHSLEQPAQQADERLGDFVEGATPRPAAEWGAYLRHDEPPAGPGRVLRAVLLSDTSPPLYYLLLWAWTRVVGTSDVALRGFSLACALACVPLLARLARRFGGRPAVLPVGFLFALTPLAIYYGTEGRMYALLWLVLLVFVELTLAVRARGLDAVRFVAWVAAGAAGFLTHYFFVFPFVAVVLACGLRPRRWRRVQLVAGVLLIGLALLPWYAHLSESLGAWRVTKGWLDWRPLGFDRLHSFGELLAGYFGGSAVNLWGEHHLARTMALLLFALLLVLLVLRLRGRAFGGRRMLPWLLLVACWSGPLVFDAARGTYTVAVERYALAGLLPAVLLPAVALAGLRPLARAAFLGALLLAWFPHLAMLVHRPTRSWCPLREVADLLEPNSGARDVIVVHSIPSGVLGVARYYDGAAPLAAWVAQLGQRRTPESLLALAHGREQVHLVVVHEVGAGAPEEGWLRANAVLGWEGQCYRARLTHFRPRDAPEF